MSYDPVRGARGQIRVWLLRLIWLVFSLVLILRLFTARPVVVVSPPLLSIAHRL